jgi:hypothetical protein
MDIKHEISLSVIRRLPDHPASHYAVQITSGRPQADERDRGALYQIMNRVHVMEPDNDRNLETFLRIWHSFGCYLLAPAVLTDGEADIMTDLTILKHGVTVIDAADVGEHDIEQIALEMIVRRDAG